ncbi:MAG: hypothetical protein ACO3QP_08675 [Burkholderiaceae bacterium]|jgi:signal transduction histidine kinase
MRPRPSQLRDNSLPDAVWVERAHAIRTPLAVISTAVDLARVAAPAKGSIDHVRLNLALASIENALQQAVELVEEWRPEP